MTRHVFRRGYYGSVSHAGEFVKETASMVFYKAGRGVTRMQKSDAIVSETDDPQATEKAYYSAWKAFNERVEVASSALASVKRAQGLAALCAAFPDQFQSEQQ